MSKQIILCADDYGYSDAVSEAILDLIDQRRINATSCMVNMPNWQQHANNLKALNSSAQIGLHLNLTEGDNSTHLKTLMLKCLTKRTNFSQLSRQIEQQFETFVDTFGHAPDFIDGHQHIHQLPGIRNCLVYSYAKYIKGTKTWVRLSANSINTMFLMPFPSKQLAIYLTGYRKLKHLLKTDHIPHNPSFAGVYDFEQYRHYRDYFKQFLQQITNNGLIMCHPGKHNVSPDHDCIANSRVAEYHYFGSETFLQDLNDAGVALK